MTAIRSSQWEPWLAEQSSSIKNWVGSTAFTNQVGSLTLIPSAEGKFERVLFITGDADTLWDWAVLPAALPPYTYHLDGELSPDHADQISLGWALGTYSFDQYWGPSKDRTESATLCWPNSARRDRIEAAALATFLVRDLINTPASDMGPAQLAEAATLLAKENGGACHILEGDRLLEENFPAVHAVGRASASDRAPRLIDLTWGEEDAPKITLVGKGVCFDTGGLNLKPSPNMKLMKKDMGGAAHVLGLASMVLKAELPIRLRVLIPAVENSISGSALRPLDIVKSRNGITIEIGHTDAEGRVILSDALAEAASESPKLIVDFATLTGAARVALGTDLPALFCNRTKLADAILEQGVQESDPMWRMPLWKPYRKLIEGKAADITNSPESPFGGSITAALFLQEFVGNDVPWAHLDLMAWNTRTRPGRPEGGEAMGMRAIYHYLEKRFSP